MEESVGPWRVREISSENGCRVSLPIKVETAAEYWIWTRSPRVFEKLPFTVGPMTLRIRTHRQRSGNFHTFPLTTNKKRIEH